MDIQKQIGKEQRDLDNTTMPDAMRTERQEFSNTSCALLAVYEAAEEAQRWIHPDAPGYIEEDLRISISSVQTSLVETVKERIADPKIVEVDIDTLAPADDRHDP